MCSYAKLADDLKKADDSWYITGPQPPERVEEVESLLNIRFPDSYRRYLMEVGRMIYGDHYYDGLCDNYLDPDNGFGSFTRYRREENDLPDGLFVLEHDHDDDAVPCLDLNAMNDGECPLVWFHVYNNVVVGPCDKNFDSYFRTLVDSWTNL